ncbi:MAG TPA: hypothetical protein VF469_31170 [Kofleriaceae bacterium]
MRIAMVTTAVLACACSIACSIPEKQLTPLGPPYACLNQPLPTTAKTQVTVTGTLSDPFAGNMVSGAVVEGFQVGIPNVPIFMTTSDTSGNFTQRQGTGNVPRDAYLKITKNGYLDTYYYPAVPISDDLNVTVQMFSTMVLGKLAAAAQVNVDPTKALFAVAVIDCNGMPVGGAMVTTDPPGDVRYFDAMENPSPVAVATDSRTGTALVANVPVSNTAINATVLGMTLHSHRVDAVPNAIMETEIQP